MTEQEERWLPVKGYEEYYLVSNYGRVMSLRGKPQKVHLLTCSPNQYGYPTVELNMPNTKRRLFRVHRLVAEAFIPNPKNKPQVDHINANRADSRASNLRWCTAKENSNYELCRQHMSASQRGIPRPWRVGLKWSQESRDKLSKSTRGEKHHNWGKHLSENTKRKIGISHSKKTLQYNLNGDLIETWESAATAAKTLGLSNPIPINACCRKNTNNLEYTSYGYKWKYSNQ